MSKISLSPVKGNSEVKTTKSGGVKRPKTSSANASDDGADTNDSPAILNELREIKDTLKILLESQQMFSDTVNAMDKRILTAEQRISDIEDREHKNTEALNELTKMATQLQLTNDKVEYLENYSRRQNVRITGVPEGAEGRRCEEFSRNLLLQLFGGEKVEAHRPLEIERTHRIGQKGQRQNRPIIVRFLRYSDRQNILELSRTTTRKRYLENPISIFPDFSPEEQRKRALFTPIRRLLKGRTDVRYGLLYPATLKITFQNHTYLFKRVEEAEAFVKVNFNTSTSSATEESMQ
ncbi:hypothetical protein AMEX_G7380 [Astyanax mexicanus]|uniref:L1 transposable element RRM domain-containing protein n=1 Tax=Astyanax mexicanus TaxID=7994 RepID=A0A8T2M6N3_ASTMX|nr:hypothetical protein AMEX_G7380 [Astyanax mexicanus]